MQPSMSVAANKHLTLDFEDYDSALYRKACAVLKHEFGFVQRGEIVNGLDEGVGPSFWRSELEIGTGWDNWSGNYLLSNSDDGDEVMRLFICSAHLY